MSDEEIQIIEKEDTKLITIKLPISLYKKLISIVNFRGTSITHTCTEYLKPIINETYDKVIEEYRKEK